MELIAGWTSPYGDITLQVWRCIDLYQVRERHHGGTDVQVTPYATEVEARSVARLSAQIIKANQPL